MCNAGDLTSAACAALVERQKAGRARVLSARTGKLKATGQTRLTHPGRGLPRTTRSSGNRVHTAGKRSTRCN
jgi:hypothetical protein